MINTRYIPLLSLLLPFSGSVVAASESNAQQESIMIPEIQQPAPNQRYTYDVFYKGLSIGQMKQAYHWTGDQVVVESDADFSFLLFSFGGNQQSDIYWSEQEKRFLSSAFFRESSGFSTVNMTANFDATGRNSVINNNGERTEYSNPEGPIVDFNTINLQISTGLKFGETDFEFYMQTSDDIAHYFFELKGKETIKTKFGELEAYRVQQVRKKDRTFIAWFAPLFNHQMVKFEYQRKVLDISGELVDYSTEF
ncbi:DUF3108 domain-containing protein [Psychromonas sp. B3M02]|uniref:DUF3108 domain-containing protein n=1 Tax=Psychromonas sp. B3M02 TaxID=2267226 RepID=UPI00215D98AF|nr:DUF3108 domain-containing protein [Psychromonas sp. B3M02]